MKFYKNRLILELVIIINLIFFVVLYYSQCCLNGIRLVDRINPESNCRLIKSKID